MCAVALKRILGIKAAFMRPRTYISVPDHMVIYHILAYGHYNDQVLKVAAANQQSVVMWDFEYVPLHLGAD